MKRYVVEITEEALLDMKKLYNYIAMNLSAPENALGQYNRIADEILKLEYFPERFKELELNLVRAKGLRRMVVDNYLVFFVIKGDRVVVTDVLYSATDIAKGLK
ncbi:toxin ParE1/3/4 [Aequitasia blattaphilus]|uniref:Type II toxin-antitoxin system RelE/ParE family toxin n=1 Tax=Aequitasia blattaphilus TaxID=2949332 RepID=A0ABT1EBH5_9FIRM|nr:type II toxin-antitoxin system RelE/ParE family toxin [Aequitasia blattaphilus]MCP1103167.1 type II toxin-antitoxin system RelE/ParE family toxin [Aequitasia blattaphilus]MCR8615807.1 type II toxin-antitoxin system RelE/ParE family toxin [Aequitasia blattaphilus]